MVVVHDDVDLETGGSRHGSAAGWRATTGCARSPRRLGSQDFLRLRVGVGPTRSRRPTPGRRLRALGVPAGGRRRSARRAGRRRGRDARRRGARGDPAPLQLTAAPALGTGDGELSVSGALVRPSHACLVTLPAHFGQHVTRSPLPSRRASGCPWGHAWGADRRAGTRRADVAHYDGRGGQMPARSHGPHLAHRLRSPAHTAPAPLAAFVDVLQRHDRFQAFARALPARARVSEPVLPLLLAPLHEELGRGLLVLLPEDADARDAAEAAGGSRAGRRVALLPGRGVGLDSGLAPPPHLVGERYRALDVLAEGGLVCASALALAEGLPPLDARPSPVELRVGDEPGVDGLAEALRARWVRARGACRRARPVRRARRASSTSSPPRAASRCASSSSATRSSRSAPSRRLRSARSTLPTSRSCIRLPSVEPISPRSTLPRRGRAADKADRPRPTRRSLPRPRLGARRGAPRLGGGRPRLSRARRGRRARSVPPKPAACVRGTAPGDRGARARRGGERARRLRARREPRRGRFRPSRRGGATGEPSAQGRDAPPRGRRGSSGRSRGAIRGRTRPPRLRLARARARPAARHAGVPQAPAPRRQAARTGARELRRPARRRLRRPRGSRRREPARLRDERGGRRHARLPLPRLPRRGPAVRPARAAREALEVHRRGRDGADALQARRQGVAEPQGARPRVGPRARGGAPPALRAAPAGRGDVLRPLERLVGAARGIVSLPRDRRPAARDRGGQGGSRIGSPDGSARVRRRRLRQDGGRRPRRIRRRDLVSPGPRPLPDDDSRRAALEHLPGALPRLPCAGRDDLPLPQAGGGQVSAPRVRRGEGRRPRWNPPSSSRGT